MPAPYTQTDLQNFWNRYVTMRQVDVIQLTTKGSAAYEPDFDAMLGICFSQRLFGFGTEGRTVWDGTGGNSDRSIGPTKS